MMEFKDRTAARIHPPCGRRPSYVDSFGERSANNAPPAPTARIRPPELMVPRRGDRETSNLSPNAVKRTCKDYNHKATTCCRSVRLGEGIQQYTYPFADQYTHVHISLQSSRTRSHAHSDGTRRVHIDDSSMSLDYGSGPSRCNSSVSAVGRPRSFSLKGKRLEPRARRVLHAWHALPPCHSYPYFTPMW